MHLLPGAIYINLVNTPHAVIPTYLSISFIQCLPSLIQLGSYILKFLVSSGKLIHGGLVVKPYQSLLCIDHVTDLMSFSFIFQLTIYCLQVSICTTKEINVMFPINNYFNTCHGPVCKPHLPAWPLSSTRCSNPGGGCCCV